MWTHSSDLVIVLLFLLLLDPCSTECPIKPLFVCLSVCLCVCVCLSVLCLFVCLSVRPSICLSICPSICQFGIFLSNGSLVFSVFYHNGRSLELLKTVRALFSRKIHFCPNFGKQGPPEKTVINFFLEII